MQQRFLKHLLKIVKQFLTFSWLCRQHMQGSFIPAFHLYINLCFYSDGQLGVRGLHEHWSQIHLKHQTSVTAQICFNDNVTVLVLLSHLHFKRVIFSVVSPRFNFTLFASLVQE